MIRTLSGTVPNNRLESDLGDAAHPSAAQAPRSAEGMPVSPLSVAEGVINS
jgi:hypothetical protein